MKKFINEWVPYLVIIVVVILIRSYIITPVIVRGDSMDETLHDGEVLLLSKISYKVDDIKRFDIVVVKDRDDDYIIKRVIGMPNDRVSYIDNVLYINDKEITKTFTEDETLDFDLEEICKINNDDCSDGIPLGKYLVLGDNRDISADSRMKGLIDKEQIIGKTVVRLWPLEKISTIKWFYFRLVKNLLMLFCDG